MAISFLLVGALSIAAVLTTWAEETQHAVDFVRFADNGSDLVVDLPGLDLALRGGANPNRIIQRGTETRSTLDEVAFICSFSRPSPQTEADCIQAIKALVTAGAKLQLEDRTILVWPVARGKAEIVAILLSLGADATAWPQDKSKTKYSPVELAAKEGHQAIVDLLVKHGATKPKESDVTQWQFINAAESGSLDQLLKLRNKGAQVNATGRDGETALLKAILPALLSRNCHDSIKVLYLLDSGADPNIMSNTGFGSTSPLHEAVLRGSYLVKFKNSHECIEAIISELIKKGAHVSLVDSHGQTPLHIAAKYNNQIAARLLLEAGAKVMPRDNEGRTPLDLAESGELIKFLKSHGAKER